MRAAPETDVLLSATDIARLAEVRRPAVSNWRRRFPDFPKPAAGTVTHPLFSWQEVEAWCAQHGKSFNPTPADRLWQRAEAVVGGVHMARFLAHVGARLATGRLPAQLTPAEPQWRPLLAEAESMEDPGALYAGLYERFRETWARQDDEISPPTARFMAELAELAEVAEGETVLDPACGTGALPAAAAESGAAVLLIQDRDPVRGDIALARMLLAGRDCRLVVGDALHDDGFAADSDSVDVVLCAPQTRERRWDQEELAVDPRWIYGLPPRSESDLAWVQHCLARTRPGGRVAVRMPAAAAGRRAGRRIRANLLRAGALRAVIEVPESLEQGTQVWLLRRPASGDSAPAHLLAVAGAPGPAEAVRAWAVFRTDPGGDLGEYATRVPIAEVLGGEVDLTPAAPNDLARGADLAERLAALRGELEDALAAAPHLLPDLSDDRARPPAATTVAALVAAGSLELHRPPLGMPTESGPLRVLTVQDLRRGRSPSGRGEEVQGAVLLQGGDVIVPPRGEGRPRVARQTEYGAALGPALTLLRPIGGALDPDFLAGFLAEETQPRRTTSGQSGVRTARLPLLPLDEQRVYGAALRRLAETEEHLRQLAELGESWADLARRALRTGTATPGSSPQKDPDAR